jgi:hypothetical protein
MSSTCIGRRIHLKYLGKGCGAKSFKLIDFGIPYTTSPYGKKSKLTSFQILKIHTLSDILQIPTLSFRHFQRRQSFTSGILQKTRHLFMQFVYQFLVRAETKKIIHPQANKYGNGVIIRPFLKYSHMSLGCTT